MAWYWKIIYIGATSVSIILLRRLVNMMYRCPSKALMMGKTVIVTGANSGIGKEAARELAKRHARVILACRDEKKANATANEITRCTKNGEVVVKIVDLSSMKSVRAFCEEIKKEEKKVDVLINNAGVMKCPYSKTEDGFENHMAVNHLGNFLMTNLLLDLLEASAPSRVVFVSSSLHRYGHINFEDLNSEEQYKRGKPYNDSKLMNILFARELHQKIHDKGISVFTLHPGMVWTNLGRYSVPSWLFILISPLFVMFARTATEGAQSIVYCSVAEELVGVSDRYYNGKCQEEMWSAPASDAGAAKKVWELSERLTGLK